MAEQRGFDTRAIHSGEKVFERSVTMPIFQTSTYVFEEEVQYTDVKYVRSNIQNHPRLGRSHQTAYQLHYVPLILTLLAQTVS